MELLARLVYRRRKIVVGIWLVLTVFGAYSAARVSNRWLEQFSIPGYSAYEANQRTLKAFGVGVRPPEPSWGTMIGDGVDHILTGPHLAIVPGTMLVIAVLGLNVFGDGVRDAFDPRATVKLER